MCHFAADDDSAEEPSSHDADKPQRLLRTVVSGLDAPREFGQRMRCEANRRRFDEAACKAFVSDGLPSSWKIPRTHSKDYTAILDFVHAVCHLFDASVACFGKTDAAWPASCDWMIRVSQSDVVSVIAELKSHQQRIGAPPPDAGEADPRERIRLEIGYLDHNAERMDRVSCQGTELPREGHGNVLEQSERSQRHPEPASRRAQ